MSRRETHEYVYRSYNMLEGIGQQKVIFDGKTTEVVLRKRGGKIVGNFSAISSLTNKKRNNKAMSQDIFDLLDQVSKGAFSVFNNLKYNRSEVNNVTKYACAGEMSKTEKEVLSRRLRELKNVGLICTMKKEIPLLGTDQVFKFKDPRKVFMINPIMIRCTNHDEAVYLWDHCA